VDIELTESLAAKDTVFISSIIKKIKAMNFSTSIDDFGVGYSSLASLKKIPFDNLKIDKSFIDDIEVDKKARDMVSCVIELGHNMGMKVLAEGVQTEHQVDILRKLKLDDIQGYYYSKPMPSFEYENFLVKNPFEKERKE
jgi:EAL domain-containing protein (putative c-di-GMP-specific phosphodiesterase class I)